MIALWISAALAGVAIAPSDGISAIGPRQPAWATLGAPHAARGEFSALSQELDAAWGERRALGNAAARTRVDRLIASLRPTLDAGARDLLQRALYLRGVLDIDEAGELDAVRDAVVVDGQRLPRSWTEAIAVSPGAAAPATADAAFATHIYDQARTALAQAGGLELDPSAPGAGEVRVDGLPVTQPVTLLPGVHTVSWHPVGADVVVLQLVLGGGSGGTDAVKVKEWLDALEAVQGGERSLEGSGKAQLHKALGSPAALLSTDGPARLVWLVDGPARWGKPKFGVGVGAGAWGFAGADAVAVACDGSAASPADALGVGALEFSMTSGPVRLRAGGGVVHAFGAGFASVAEGTCASGLTPNVEMVTTLPWGWASIGRRFGLSRTQEIEPFLRVGGTGAHAVAQVGTNVRFGRGPIAVDLRASAGPAFNLWSGDDPHLAFAGGLETVVSIGGR